jgi:hypothetical protein
MLLTAATVTIANSDGNLLYYNSYAEGDNIGLTQKPVSFLGVNLSSL